VSFAIADTLEELGALTDLCRMADRAGEPGRWGAFDASDRFLATRWEWPRSRVIKLLDRLVAEGLVVVVYPGDRQNPRRIRLACPLHGGEAIHQKSHKKSHDGRPDKVIPGEFGSTNGSTNGSKSTDPDTDPKTNGGLPTTDGGKGKGKEMSEAIDRVYAAWFERHPRALPVAGEQDRRKIRDRLRELTKQTGGDLARAVEIAILVSEWAHLAPDASHWRGINNRGKGGRGKKFLGISALYKPDKWPDRLSDALEWQGAGKPAADLEAETDQRRGQSYDAEARGAWDWTENAVRLGKRSPPAAWAGTPKGNALAAALEAVGGLSEVSRSRERDTPRIRAAFVAAYLAERSGGQS
jgi:hypothetical protein